MKTRLLRLSAVIDRATRRKLYDLRDRLETLENTAFRRRHDAARPVRFNKNGIRVLEANNHAYAR